MKIELSTEATQAIKSIKKSLCETHPFIDKRFSRLVSAIVVETLKSMDGKLQDNILTHLITPSGRKKALMKSLMSLSENLDDESFSKLEINVKKFCQTLEKITEKAPKIQ